jgi:hypothetical protein
VIGIGFLALVLAGICAWPRTAGAADPYPDRVVDLLIGDGGGFNLDAMPGVVLGGPRGGGLFTGSEDVLSLGRGGVITLAFDDALVVDRAGADFIVFENPFLTGAGSVTGVPFAEAAQVFVSADGVDFVAFPCAIDAVETFHPGCAGVFPVLADVDEPAGPLVDSPTMVPIASLVGVPVSAAPPLGAGGDAFDLADVGLRWIRFIRIVSGAGAGPGFEGKAGFDLDAIVAVHRVSAVESDVDADGVVDFIDNCPVVANPNQDDVDGDGIGNPCDACPAAADPTQADRDADGVGDACDPCPDDPLIAQGNHCTPAALDTDADGVGDDRDNCPSGSNPPQDDADGDRIGDVCDPCPDDADCGPLTAPVYAGSGADGAGEALLTFAAPAERSVTLPSDANGAALWVNFSATVDPSSLRATVRGRDVTALFTPVVPGSSKRVVVPLAGGRRTRFVVRVKQQIAAGRRAKDVDRIVFVRRAR